MKITHFFAWPIAALGLLLPPAASATETFFAELDMSPPINCSVPQPFNSNTNGASLGVTCGDSTAVGSSAASVQHGQVGASAIATDISGSMLAEGLAIWQDDSILITAVGNPGQIGTTTASLNFGFQGHFGGLGVPSSNATAFLAAGILGTSYSVFLQHADNGDSCQGGGPVDLCSAFDGSVGLPVVVSTPLLTLPVGTPFEVDFLVQVSAESIGPGASTDGGFQAFGFVGNGQVLTFSEPGFTVNAGSYIVNNRYIAPVDEPALPVLFALGLAALSGVAALRRRAPDLG